MRDDVSLLDHAIQVISEKKSRVNSRKGKIRFVLLVLHKGREKWRRRRRRRLPSNLSLSLSFWQPIKRTANRSHGTLLISSGAEERIDTEEPKGARGLNSNPPISSPSPPPLEFAFLDAVEPTGDPGEELTFPLLLSWRGIRSSRDLIHLGPSCCCREKRKKSDFGSNNLNLSFKGIIKGEGEII